MSVHNDELHLAFFWVFLVTGCRLVLRSVVHINLESILMKSNQFGGSISYVPQFSSGYFVLVFPFGGTLCSDLLEIWLFQNLLILPPNFVLLVSFLVTVCSSISGHLLWPEQPLPLISQCRSVVEGF